MNGSSDVNRRDFLKKSGKAVLTVGSATVLQDLFGGCVSSGPTRIMFREEEGKPKFKTLSEGKIDLEPISLGFWGLFETLDGGSFRVRYPESVIRTYENLIGVKPAIWTGFIWRRDGLIEYRHRFFDETTEQGVIPFEFMSLKPAIREYGSLSSLIDNKNFLETIEKYAQDAAKNKKKYLCCTMRELNLSHLPWGQQPKTAKKVFEQIHQIFFDNGADPYVNWVQEVYVSDNASYGSKIGDPLRYIFDPDKIQYLGISGNVPI